MDNKDTFKSIALANINRVGIHDLLNYIEENGFYEDPASAKYHLAIPGGLCQHSLNVYDRLLDYLYECDFDRESVAIVSLFHDLCKMGTYTTGIRNVKTYDKETLEKYEDWQIREDEIGKYVWVAEKYYKNDDKFPYGHGEKSVYLISKFIRLTDEEAMAIRYHMGAWNKEEAYNAGKVFASNKLAFYLHLADEMATFIDESEGA